MTVANKLVIAVKNLPYKRSWT